MKKQLSILSLLLLFLVGCSDESTTTSDDQKEKTKEEQEIKKDEVKTDKKQEKEKGEKESSINTDVFLNATKVEVTDARDITNHVTAFIHVKEKAPPAVATQQVLIQTYDFLQQQDVAGAKTFSIVIKQGDYKIFQIDVTKDKFTPTNDPKESMIKKVIEASKIVYMTDGIEEYGKSTGFW